MGAQCGDAVGTYRFTFEYRVSMDAVRESLLLAAMAAESLHGRSGVHLDATFHMDEETRTCVIDAGTEVGRDIARIFTGYLSREFGEGAYRVERLTVKEQ